MSVMDSRLWPARPGYLHRLLSRIEAGRGPDHGDHAGDRDKGADVRDDGAMRRPLAVVGVAAALGMALPAHADPGSSDPNLDASFLDALTKAGITVISP